MSAEADLLARKPVVLPVLKWDETPNQSDRSLGAGGVRLVVAHRWADPVPRNVSEALGFYHGTINHLKEPPTDASAHVVYGGSLVDEATQLVPWHRKAWSCETFNSITDNLEFADGMWFGHDEPGLRVAARMMAFRLHVRGLPARWIRGEALQHSTGRGMTRHYDLGSLGGGHTDPTTDNALWELFVAMTKHELVRGGFRTHWGV
jgi:hypothetical protein